MYSSNKNKLSLALTLTLCMCAPLSVFAGANEPSQGDYSEVYESGSSDASGADITYNTTITGKLYGGYAVGGNATNNKVTLGSSGNASHVYAGYSQNSNANNNTLTIKDGVNMQNGEVAAGSAGDYMGGGTGGDANHNHLIMEGGTVVTAIGGIAMNGSASNNYAQITGNATVRSFAGASAKTLAEHNTAELRAGTVTAQMYGAAANTANYNTAIVIGGKAEAEVVGGMAQLGSANYNRVEITGGAVKEVYGGVSAVQADYNTVLIGGAANITGNTIAGAMYDSGGSGSYNTVTIEGTPTYDPRILIYGALEINSTNGTRTGNTLNIYTSNISVATVDHFQHYDLALDKNKVTLTVGDALALQAGDTIKSSRVLSELSVGDVVTVLKSEDSITLNGATLMEGEAKRGALYIYNYKLRQDTNGHIVADIIQKETNKQTMSVADGQLAAMGMLRSGADLISGNAMATAAQNASQYDVFATMNYGNYNMNSVSNIDVQGTSMLVGVSRNLQHSNSNTIIGAFIESGWGTYDSELGEAKAKGHTNYYGLGILARNNKANGLYLEGSLRVGKVGNTYSGHSADDGMYDASSTYYGLHLGIGKINKINENTNIDYYGKYFWAHESGTDATLLGDKFDFDAIDSHRVRVGARLNNTNKNVTRYVGLAYEHEFSGTAKASAYGIDIASPSAKGSSGLLELGATYKPATDSRFSMDVGLNGYVGKRQGVSGNLKLNWAF